MAEMKISNTLVNDTSDKTIAYAEQLKQQIINWAEYNHVTEKLGPNNRPNTQNLLNNLFLRVYEEFLTFLNNADATDQAINTWKEIEAFLAGYTDDKTLASIVAQLNANIESRLNVQLADETGDSVTTTMTQKAITKAINSVSFSTGEKVKEIGIADEPTAGSDNLVRSGGVFEKTVHRDGQIKKFLAAITDKNGRAPFYIDLLGQVFIPLLHTLIHTDSIAEGAVTSDKLAERAVTPEKIDMGDEISGTQTKPVPGSVIKGFAIEKSVMIDKKYIFAIVTNRNQLLFGITRKGLIKIPNSDELANLARAFLNSLHPIEDKKYIFAIVDKYNRVIFGIKKNGSIKSISLDYIIDYINEKTKNITIETTDTEGSTWLDRTEMLLNKEDNSNKNFTKDNSGDNDRVNDSEYIKALVGNNGFPVYAIHKDGSFIISDLVLIDKSTGDLYNLFIDNGQISITQKN